MKLPSFIFFTLFFLSIVIAPAFGQASRKAMKVSYTYTTLSPSMIGLLKKQSPTPEQYQTIISTIQEYRAYYSLYVNLKNNESIFVLDSIKTHPLVSPTGSFSYVYTTTEGIMRGSEEFIQSVVNFSSNIADTNWELLGDTKEISNYECENATIYNHSDIEVWFTKDISVNKGPAYFQGVFGLVLEANDFFGTLYATKIDYSDNTSIMDELIEKYKNENKPKSLSLNEVLALKENTIRTLKVGLN